MTEKVLNQVNSWIEKLDLQIDSVHNFMIPSNK